MRHSLTSRIFPKSICSHWNMSVVAPLKSTLVLVVIPSRTNSGPWPELAGELVAVQSDRSAGTATICENLGVTSCRVVHNLGKLNEMGRVGPAELTIIQQCYEKNDVPN